MNTHYRTLITGELVQESALTVGGNRPHELVDIPLAKDGAGRPVIRGSTLAGVFIHTARNFLGRDVPREISTSTEESQLTPSRWRFEHAHLQNPVETIFCQHVSIDQRTGAAADDHLFNLEAIPRGQRWGFSMEIVPQLEDNEDKTRELEALALPVLREWSRPGGCRLGHGSRHGYGWLHLENLRIWRLNGDQIAIWHAAQSEKKHGEALFQRLAEQGIQPLNLDAFTAHCAPAFDKLERQPNTVIEFAGTLTAGERQDDFGKGYGLDSLSIGGHARLIAQTDRWFHHINQPQGIPRIRPEDFNPDFLITAHQRPDGQLEPYVPSAGMRGVWRAAMSRTLRAQREKVRNPGGPDKSRANQETNHVDILFGDTSRAGVLSLADAYPADDNWRLAWQQHVAIDELTGGAYESSKFDRLSLLSARFAWCARIEMAKADKAEELAQAIENLLHTLGSTRHLPLGGGQWRGHGHVQWELATRTVRQLGELA